MTTEDYGANTRALLESLRQQQRVLITDPDSVDRVRAAAEDLGRGPFLEVRASPHCPPGRILVVDPSPLEADLFASSGAPSMPGRAELQDAGVALHVDRIRAEAEAALCKTRSGRLAWRLSGWIARHRRRKP